ncbi:GH3 family domain-containing protein [Plastoroseomonas hellenica]|uniref:GH3 family domain-containing protein n=1 Tax=Plastoroseomonas hellenica TaxID=2687306 RepID=UPI001BAC1ACB|nr:GH3 auxin-responsive promoter family protein [Plastoroseomonas hellenica]MBR0646951.1 GH3 auxin-responsive promoter family protein [Plastoroseomonas hellenica]
MTQGPPFDATPLLRGWAVLRRARLRRLDPAATQQALLLGWLRRAADTAFGRQHGFASIRSVADYQARVPLRRYEEFWDGWWKPAFPLLRNVTWPGLVPYFALSSGTTSGNTKRIPVTRDAVMANRDAALDVLAHHLGQHPHARLFAGLSFMLGGSTALEEVAPGVREGDLSGIAAAEIPHWISGWGFPPPKLALISDWDRKLDALVEQVPAEAVRMLSGTPSWLLVLLHRLQAHRGGALPLPALELLVHGGVAWEPYRARFQPLLPPGCATREVYPASEGFIAIADRGNGEGMALVLDRGVFAEFVPLAELGTASPTRHWAATLETGIDYAVVVTSNAGLWSCVLGDTVRFVDRSPPRLLVTGRIAYDLSVFGEHLSGAEIDAALGRVLAATGSAPGEYCVGAAFEGSAGRHHWFVELDGRADPGGLSAGLDADLRQANADYAAHREAGQLLPPRLVALPLGTFEAWLRSQGKLGGQHKVPRVLADPRRFAELADWMQAHLRGRGE